MVLSTLAHEDNNGYNDNTIVVTIIVGAENQETWNPVLLLTLMFYDLGSRYFPCLDTIFNG